MAKGRTQASAFEISIKSEKNKKERTVTSYLIDVDLKKPIKRYSVDTGKSISDIINAHLRQILEENGYL